MIRGGKLDKPIRVLIVDDEESIVTSTSWWLQRLGYECVKASSVEEAQAKLSETPFDVVVTDIRMPGSTGIDLLKTAKERDPDIQVIVMTGSPSLDFAVEAIRSSSERSSWTSLSRADRLVVLLASLADWTASSRIL